MEYKRKGAVKLTKEKMRKANLIYAVIMIIISLIFVAALLHQYSIRQSLISSEIDMEIQLTKANAEGAALKKQFDNQNDPEFIEKAAREKLNMVKPNEIVFIDENTPEGKQLLKSTEAENMANEIKNKENAQ